jgi:hypothetical protein
MEHAKLYLSPNMTDRTWHTNFVRTEGTKTDIGYKNTLFQFLIVKNTAKTKYSEIVSDQHNALCVCSLTTAAGVSVNTWPH